MYAQSQSQQQVSEPEQVEALPAEESSTPQYNSAALDEMPSTAVPDEQPYLSMAAEETGGVDGMSGDELDVATKDQINQAGVELQTLMDQRMVFFKDVWDCSETMPVGNEHLALLDLAMNMALGATAAGIGGAVSSQIAQSAVLEGSKLGTTFVKAAFKDVIDGQVQGVAQTSLDGILSAFLPGLGGDANKAFFESQYDGLTKAVGDAATTGREAAREAALDSEDPLAAASAVVDGVNKGIVASRDIQSKEAITGWMQLLAEVDLGTGEDQGTDLSGMEWDNLSWFDAIAGEPAYGVVRVDMVGMGTDGKEFVVNRACMGGTNKEFVEEFRGLDLSLEELGVNVFVSGDVYVNVGPTSWVEFGCNDAGSVSVAPRDDNSEAWLGFYAREQFSQPNFINPSEPEEWQEAAQEASYGATIILDQLMSQTPRQLDVEHG